MLHLLTFLVSPPIAVGVPSAPCSLCQFFSNQSVPWRTEQSHPRWFAECFLDTCRGWILTNLWIWCVAPPLCFPVCVRRWDEMSSLITHHSDRGFVYIAIIRICDENLGWPFPIFSGVFRDDFFASRWSVMHYKVMCFVMLTQLFVKALDLGLTDSPTGRFLKKNLAK